TYLVKDGSRTVFSQQGTGITWQTDSQGHQYYPFSDANLTLGSTHSYVLTLTNAGGTTNTNANPRFPETVESQCAIPTATLSATATHIAQGASTNLNWTAAGQEISGCTATGWTAPTVA